MKTYLLILALSLASCVPPELIQPSPFPSLEVSPIPSPSPVATAPAVSSPRPPVAAVSVPTPTAGLPSRTLTIGEISGKDPATWTLKPNCGDPVKSITYLMGVYAQENLIIQNGNIHDLVNQKAMMLTMDARAGTGSLTVKNVTINGDTINYNYTGGCRAHIDGVYVRGNAPEASMFFENVTIKNTVSPSGDKATMTMLFNGVILKRVVFKNLQATENLGQPTTLSDTMEELWITGGTKANFVIGKGTSRLKRVYLLDSPGVNPQSFCASGAKVFVNQTQVSVCN